MQILCFGIAKDIAGGREIDLNLVAPVTVSQLKKSLAQRYAQLAGTGYMVAVNACYARDEDLVQEGDEVAIIPPVSGG